MLTPHQITFYTIFGGVLFAFVIYLFAGKTKKQWLLPMDTILGMVANAMTLTTILCFLTNIGHAVFVKSFSGKADPAVADADAVIQAAPIYSLGIDGNEATAFFAFLYAGGMIVAAVKRNVDAIPVKELP